MNRLKSQYAGEEDMENPMWPSVEPTVTQKKVNYLRTNIPLYRATIGSAGYELVTQEDFTLKPNTSRQVNTGVKIDMTKMERELSRQYYFKIHAKSGLYVRHFISPFPGVIDIDYVGEIIVILRNDGGHEHTFKAGDSVAQMTIEKYHTFANERIKLSDHVHTGFGSTNQ